METVNHTEILQGLYFVYLLVSLMKKNLSWLHWVACGIFVSPSGIESRALVVQALSPNHWTTRGFPLFYFIYSFFTTIF